MVECLIACSSFMPHGFWGRRVDETETSCEWDVCSVVFDSWETMRSSWGRRWRGSRKWWWCWWLSMMIITGIRGKGRHTYPKSWNLTPEQNTKRLVMQLLVFWRHPGDLLFPEKRHPLLFSFLIFFSHFPDHFSCWVFSSFRFLVSCFFSSQLQSSLKREWDTECSLPMSVMVTLLKKLG